MNKHHLLIVEDNEGDICLLEEAFEEAGLPCDVTPFSDGEQALAHIREYVVPQDRSPYDAILLDLNLPKVDGLSILAAVRANGEMVNVPLVVMTSSTSPKDRERVEAFGIDRLIVKPSDLDEFLKIGTVVKELIERRAQTACGNNG